MINIFKKLYILILVLPLLITGCNKQIQDEKSSNKDLITPLFYKISKEDSNVNIYLLGSIHAADDTIYPLNDKIMSAYKGSDYLAVEVDTVEFNNNLKLQLDLSSKLLYNDGKTIRDDFGEELYNKMVNFLKEKKSYVSIYDKYRPAFFESLFESIVIKDAKMDLSEGIDMYFLLLAKDDKKNILEIESAESQIDLLLNNPIELDKMMIDQYVNNYEETVNEMKDLYESWKSGDIEKLEKSFSIDENLSEEQIELISNYNKTLINNRNYIMVEAFENYINGNKNTFCIVGVGHVVGDEGIISLLEDRGYIIEKINLN